jgi:hypothetical protein
MSTYSWDRATRAYKPRVADNDDELPMSTFGPLSDYGYRQVMGDDVPSPTRRPANDNAALPQYDPNKRFGDFLQVYSGRTFYPMDPRTEDVNIVDIAHALSMQCRYAGHCLRFYSVLEHSVHIADWLLPRYGTETALCGLLHDATETYLVDVPRPVKPHLGGYKAAELNIWRKAIAPAFGLPLEIPAAVHEADTRILLDERAQNMSPAKYEGGWPDVEPLGVMLHFWPPEVGELWFLTRYRQLVAARNVKVAA